jgi:hypothetical protein
MTPLDALISRVHDLDSHPRLDDKMSSDFFHAFPLSSIFEIISSGSEAGLVTERPMHVITSVLGRLLTTTKPGKVILSEPSTTPFLQAAMQSAFPSLRRLAVRTLSCGLVESTSMDNAVPILLQLISAMADRDTGVATLAEESLSSWAGAAEERSRWILQNLLISPSVEHEDSTCRLRALSLLLTLLAKGDLPEGNIQVSKSLMRELGGQDPLSALACLESVSTKLTSLCSLGKKLKPLINEVAHALSITLPSLLEDPICRSMAIASTSEIIGCAIAIGCLSEVAKVQLLLLKTIRSTLSDSSQGSSVDEEVTALDACTRIVSLGGLLAAEAILMDPVIASGIFERAFQGGRSDRVKIVALHTMAAVASQDLSLKCEPVLRKLLYESSPVHGPTDVLSKLISLPFEESKEAALRALLSMLKESTSRLYFGADVIRNQALIALLLDPSSQQTSPACTLLRQGILDGLLKMSSVSLEPGVAIEEHAQNLALLVEASGKLKKATARGPYEGKREVQDPITLVTNRV